MSSTSWFLHIKIGPFIVELSTELILAFLCKITKRSVWLDIGIDLAEP